MKSADEARKASQNATQGRVAALLQEHDRLVEQAIKQATRMGRYDASHTVPYEIVEPFQQRLLNAGYTIKAVVTHREASSDTPASIRFSWARPGDAS